VPIKPQVGDFAFRTSTAQVLRDLKPTAANSASAELKNQARPVIFSAAVPACEM